MDELWAKEAESRIDAYERGELKAVALEKVLEKYK
ncbi:MAG: addiction module protein [Candidatus Hodarchaeota archaeon]